MEEIYVYLVYKTYGYEIDAGLVKVFLDKDKARRWKDWENDDPENKIKQITYRVEARRVE